MVIVGAVSAALAVWLWTSPGAGQLRRLGGGTTRTELAWLPAKPGAPPLAVRGAFGLAAAVAALVVLPGGVGVVAGVIVAVVVVLVAGQVESTSARTEREALVGEQPLALDLLAAALEAGAPLANAVRAVADVSPPATAGMLGSVAAHVSVGASDADAWDLWRDHPVWGEVARDVSQAATSGTALAGVLGMQAVDSRARAREARQARAKRVGIKVALPLMCCFLPSFLCLGVIPIVASLLGRFLGW